ncbi:MAG: anaerobic sulfatase maturase [Coriobacteriales bacterium]|nr:anaerobic sulfatase maturase [Coriobacteriales bacterium]
MASSKTDPYRTYAMMAKPVGASCNLCCSYCYYRDIATHTRMSDEVLESYIQQTIAMHGSKAAVEFVWHGGEPLLAGIDFYRRAAALQRKYANGRVIVNNIQTNGTLINAAWAEFFAQESFIVGVSCDGPKNVHDAYRHNAAGSGSWQRVIAGINTCTEAGVRVDGLCAVHAANVGHPQEVYTFLRSLFPLIQFLPVCDLIMKDSHPSLSPESVKADSFGKFLCTIYDMWTADDPATRPVISTFEAIMRMSRGEPAGICEFEPTCGHAGSVEADGSVYACDRFADKPHILGNLLKTNLETLMEQNRPFGTSKLTNLAPECLDCAYLRLCFGGCPKKRIALAASGSPINALCAAYRQLFSHINSA